MKNLVLLICLFAPFFLKAQYDINGDFKISGNLGIGINNPRARLELVGGNLFVERGGELNFSINGDKRAGISSTNSSPYNELQFFTGSYSESMRIDADGNVGIGINNPRARLELVGGNLFVERGGELNFSINGDKRAGISSTNSSPYNELQFFTGSYSESMRIDADGNVGIGVTNPTQKLQVAGTVYSTEVKVEVAAGQGPDYVFEPNYELRTLQETKKYISENKHLPEIPSAKEMEANGVDLGDMNMRLLKKIEELTLYQIELLERLEKAEQEISQLKLKDN